MDLAARRQEFPALATREPGVASSELVVAAKARLAYLDSAATTLTPRAVIDAVTTAMRTMGNPGRGVYAMAQAASDAIADAREIVAAALRGWRDTRWASPTSSTRSSTSAPSSTSAMDIVFTNGTTASTNLVADTWGAQHVGQGDVVIASEAEHHSNLLPWQRLCERAGAQLVLARVDDRGRFDLDAFRALLATHGERTKLVAIAHVSNVLGTIAPIADIAHAAHAVGAKVFVDGAQAIAHLDVDVTELGCDFYAFSGHKVYGVPGAGVLWAAHALLETMPPWQLGGGMVSIVGGMVSSVGAMVSSAGDMVSTVEPASSTWREAPARFEAGTPNTPAIVGLATALVWAREIATTARTSAMTQATASAMPIGTRSIRADEADVHAALCETLRGLGARILGEPEVGVVSFAWDYHPHDIATIADREGVALRSGHHCAQLVHRRFGIDASTRASVGCYSGLDDVEQLARALVKVREVLGPR